MSGGDWFDRVALRLARGAANVDRRPAAPNPEEAGAPRTSTRRQLLQRSAAVGAAALASPVIQSVTAPAWAVSGQCSDASQCPPGNGTCSTATCVGGTCGFAFAPSSTLCGPQSCSNGTATAASHCDGAGACVSGASTSCGNYVCNPSTSACYTSCTTNADCASGVTCSGGVCRKAQGVACTGDNECASGFCTDGVCCEARCGGTCEKCNQTGRVGFCDAVPAGTDPDNECSTEAPATCGRTGFCSGSRTCALYSSGTQCVAGSCSSGTQTAASTCNGSGVCVSGGTTSCGNYVCNGSTCYTSCTTSAQCAAGHVCNAGVCT